MEALAQQCDLVKSLVSKTMTSYLALVLRIFITNGDHKLHCSTVNSLSCIFHLIINPFTKRIGLTSNNIW